MAKPGVKDELAQTGTLQLSWLCTCASGRLLPQSVAQERGRVAVLWGEPPCIPTSGPLLSLSITELTPASTQLPLGPSSPAWEPGEKEAPGPDRVEQEAESQAAAGEWSRHTPNPPRDVPPQVQDCQFCRGSPKPELKESLREKKSELAGDGAPDRRK